MLALLGWRPAGLGAGVALVLGVVGLAGCSYPGPGGAYDYGMAANAAWVVATGTSYVCRYRTWGASADNHCSDPAILACGTGGVQDGPTPVYDVGTDRFYYAAQVGGLCVSSAPGSDPFVIDRAYVFSRAQLQLTNMDQPHLAVSSDKIAVTANEGTDHSNTFVINKQEYLNNAPAHTAVVQHPNVVTPSIIVGDGGAIAWAHSGGSRTLTIGLITGVPGVNGGITTTSATVSLHGTAAFALANNPTPGGSLIVGDHAIWGGTLNAVLDYAHGGELLTTTRIDSRDGHQLEVDRIGGISPTFAPSIITRALVSLPPGGTDFDCESLSTTQAGEVLVGFSSSGTTLNLTPYVVLWRNNSPIGTPIPVSADQVFPSVGLRRIDFCPTGAWFPDALRPGQDYACIGLNADVNGAANNSFEDGKEAVCIRDGLF